MAVTAIEAIKILETNQRLIRNLYENSETMYNALQKIQGVTILGDIGSPFFHILVGNSQGSRLEDEKILQEVVDLAAGNGVLLTRAKYVTSQEINCPPPSIRVCVSSGFLKRDVERCANVIKDCVRRALKNNQKF